MEKRVCRKSDEVENCGGLWEGILPELLASITVKMSAEERMQVVPFVCRAWREVIVGPHCWTDIELRQWSCRPSNAEHVDRVVRKLVRHSRSTFQRLSVYRLGDVGFAAAANRARCLRVLIMPMSNVTEHMVIRHAESFDRLTHLDISYCENITWKGLEAFGKQCKSLIYLNRNMPRKSLRMSFQWEGSETDDSEALVIANTMTNLQHLELRNGLFTSVGLNSILTECKALKYLDIDDTDSETESEESSDDESEESSDDDSDNEINLDNLE